MTDKKQNKCDCAEKPCKDCEAGFAALETLREKHQVSDKSWEGYKASLDLTAQRRENEILMFGPIVRDSEAAFIRQGLGDEVPFISPMSFREALDAVEGNVVLRLNSPGGEVTSAAAIRALISDRRATGDRVDVVVSGTSASAAAVIMTAADTISIYPLSTVMIHQASAGAMGNASDLRSVASALEAFDQMQAEVFAERMELEVDDVADLLAAETYFSAAEAVESGIADALIESSGNEETEGAQDAPSDPDTSGQTRRRRRRRDDDDYRKSMQDEADVIEGSTKNTNETEQVSEDQETDELRGPAAYIGLLRRYGR